MLTVAAINVALVIRVVGRVITSWTVGGSYVAAVKSTLIDVD